MLSLWRHCHCNGARQDEIRGSLEAQDNKLAASGGLHNLCKNALLCVLDLYLFEGYVLWRKGLHSYYMFCVLVTNSSGPSYLFHTLLNAAIIICMSN